MKVVALVSGGKDSCYAMMRCIDYGHEVSHFGHLGRIPDESLFHMFDGPSVDLQIVALANLMPLDDSVDELDSYMYQTVSLCYVVLHVWFLFFLSPFLLCSAPLPECILSFSCFVNDAT